MNAEVSDMLDSPTALIESAESYKVLLFTRPEDASPEEIIGAFFRVKVANYSVVTDYWSTVKVKIWLEGVISYISISLVE